MIGFPSSVNSVLNHAELSVTDSDNALIHMDVDQSFLPIPTPVKAAIFESFVRQNIAESEIDVTGNIRQLIESSYGFSTNSKTEFIYADCPLALLVNWYFVASMKVGLYASQLAQTVVMCLLQNL